MRATRAEAAAALPGDELVPDADVVLDTALDLPAPPDRVWPWINQLGRHRAGWYLPRRIERLVPPGRRALRHIDPSWPALQAGDVIDDWGGRRATFEIVTHRPPDLLLHRSTRGHLRLSWAIVLWPDGGGTRMQLRLRLAGVRRRTLVRVGGGLFDRLTVAGLGAGLTERLTGASSRRPTASSADRAGERQDEPSDRSRTKRSVEPPCDARPPSAPPSEADSPTDPSGGRPR